MELDQKFKETRQLGWRASMQWPVEPKRRGNNVDRGSISLPLISSSRSDDAKDVEPVGGDAADPRRRRHWFTMSDAEPPTPQS
jgi:hypothetical protein